MLSINCKGTIVEFTFPKVMGILNLTPDSFYDGGHFQDLDQALTHCERMLLEGADFIDLGAYSSRPGAKNISEDEEKKRLLPILSKLVEYFPESFFSVDTFRAGVAKEAIEAGAALVNDISAGNIDPNILNIVAQFKVPYIAMHMQGTPSSMQANPHYNNIVDELILFFSKKIDELYQKGIHDVIIDPGFGFGKTSKHNFTLLQNLDVFQTLNVPVLAGISRKSMIYKTLESSASKALNGSTALHSIALYKKAQLLRVHDVKEAKECITLIEQLH